MIPRRALPALLSSLALACGGGSSLPELKAATLSVEGRAVETASGGPATAAGPTVVFEAGEGDDLGVWHSTAPLVAQKSKVFLYTRAGYGKSTPASGARDGARLVEELRSLLDVASVPRPIVLVAHSDAGMYGELYAKSHPEEIAGLALVEPRHRDFDRQCKALGLTDCDISDDQATLLPAAFRAEYQDLPATIAELNGLGNLGSTPLRVITGSGVRNESVIWQQLWSSLHKQLAAESTQGKQVFAGISAHYPQINQPDFVAATVAEVLALIR